MALAAFRQLQSSNKPAKGAKYLVFPNTEGEHLRSARDWFEPAVQESRLHDFTWHATDTHSPCLFGVDIRTVAQPMGHSTIQVTMRYAHLAPEHNQAAVDRLVAVSVGTSGD